MKRLLVLVLSLFVASAAWADEAYYETFDGLVSGGATATSFGVDENSVPFATVYGGGATNGFTARTDGYVDDASASLEFSSFEGNALQNSTTSQTAIGSATRPYVLSFALKLDDSNTTGSFVQLVAPVTFFNPGPGYRTSFLVQLWEADFISNGDPSYLVVTPFSPADNTPQFSATGAPGVLEGANGFVDDGSVWNFVFVLADPDTTTMRAWINPTSDTATPDIEETSFDFGSPDAPHMISYGAYTFLSDTTPGTEKTVNIDSVKLFYNDTPAALFAEAFNSYSTLASASVKDWTLFH